MKVSVDVHKPYSTKSLAEIRNAIAATATLQAAFGSLKPHTYRQFTDNFRSIALVAHSLGAERISKSAHEYARAINHSWKRPLLSENVKPIKLYLCESEYYAWIAYPVADRNNFLNDYLAVGPVLERAAVEPSVPALVEKVWGYWMANPESEAAWRYISETLEALS